MWCRLRQKQPAKWFILNEEHEPHWYGTCTRGKDLVPYLVNLMAMVKNES